MPEGPLTAAQLDRAVGAVVGMAIGNALGGGYAFEPRPRPQDVRMRSGGLGPYAAGEWGDDTAMAIPILEMVQEGHALLDPATQDEVVRRWVLWSVGTPDVAPVVARVLAAYDPQRSAQSLREAAAEYERSPTLGAGNASLMRTTPVALGYLRDPHALSRAARTYSDLTHGNPVAGDACVLWNLAQRRAIMDGTFDLAGGLPYLPDERRSLWEPVITQAEVGSPEDFAIHNGFARNLLQTSWSAIVTCATEGPQHFEDALRLVVAAGGDTPTAAAVTGGLLGARWGVSAIPLEWRRVLFGWPGYRDRDLVWMVRQAIDGQPRPDHCYPDNGARGAVAHPDDAGVLLGGTAGLPDLPTDVGALLSLCELGDQDRCSVAQEEQVDVWLVDSPDADDNPHLEFVVNQAVEMLVGLRSRGHRVYVCSGHGRRRLPLVAAVYGARIAGLPAARILERLRPLLGNPELPAPFEDLLRNWD